MAEERSGYGGKLFAGRRAALNDKIEEEQEEGRPISDEVINWRYLIESVRYVCA